MAETGEFDEVEEYGSGPVDCMIEDERWLDIALPVLADRAARSVLDWLSLDPDRVEIVCLACNDERIAALNAEFLGKPQATNVLSWPAAEPGLHEPGTMPQPQPGEDGQIALGDIAIAWETCSAEAEAQGKPLANHVSHLLIHGILHLAGFDHVNEMDAEVMEGIERHVLASLEIPDPYAEERSQPI